MSYWHISIAARGVIGRSPWFLRDERREHFFSRAIYFRVRVDVMTEIMTTVSVSRLQVQVLYKGGTRALADKGALFLCSIGINNAQ